MTEEEKAAAAAAQAARLEAEKGKGGDEKTDAEKIIDYQAQVAKLETGYKEEEKKANKYKSALTKTRSVLEKEGLAEYDENWNVVVKVPQKKADPDKQVNELDKLNSKAEALQKKYDDGDIDPDKFNKEIRIIDKAIIKEELRGEYQTNRVKEKETDSKADATKKETQFWLNTLGKDFPEFDDENSELFKEMDNLYQGNPLYKDAGGNLKDRYQLAREAARSLEAKGIKVKQAQTEKINAGRTNMATLNSGAYDDDGTSENLQPVTNTVAGKHIASKFGNKMLQDLNKDFSKQAEEGGTEFDFS